MQGTGGQVRPERLDFNEVYNLVRKESQGCLRLGSKTEWVLGAIEAAGNSPRAVESWSRETPHQVPRRGERAFGEVCWVQDWGNEVMMASRRP